MNVLLLLILLLFPSVPVAGQALLQSLDGIPVEADGEWMDYPFYGGWHRLRAHFLDMDGDGDFDLITLRPPCGPEGLLSSPQLSKKSAAQQSTPGNCHPRIQSSSIVQRNSI